jgi:glycerol-3-phosphate dehydrogenase (NAD(P)+)
MKAAVIGSGAWGTALAICLHNNGHQVTLWTHSESKAQQMRSTGISPRLPNVQLPADMVISSEFSCVQDQDLVVVVCPSFSIRSVCQGIAPYLSEKTVLVSATKGIESATHLRMSQVIGQETGKEIVVLTGPSHAEEVSGKIPTGCLAACENRTLAEFVQEAFSADYFRIYTSPDAVGAELGGALKNVIAMCAGVTDGLGCGDNTKALLMTRGLTEIARLGLAMGAQKETFAGLAGVGDLIVTCTSMHSRNRRAGVLIGQGKDPQTAMQEVGAVVEGYYCAQSAWELAQAMGVDMPIASAAYRVLYEGASAAEAVKNLLQRKNRAESEDAGWQ